MRIRALLILTIAAMLAIASCSSGNATVTVVVTSTPVPTATPKPTATPIPTGSITGHLGYPSEFIPPLAIYAISTTSTGTHFHVDTAHNQTTYTIKGVKPGTYHVIAYLKPDQPALRGGYSQFVLCGLAASCPSHALVNVVVHPGETVKNVDPTDFYAPAGTFPPPPSS